jgi:membrane-bound lytic murein transglycosylase D
VLIAALTFACAGARTAQKAPPQNAQTPPPQTAPEPAAPRTEAREFQIASNDVVMAQVRHLTGTPGARQNLRSALAHRRKHLAAVRAALAAQHLPLQLDAIPLIESGYENLDGGKNGAGLWQFVKVTAVHYGLHISSEVDERMNPALETAAAARYLRDLYRELQDWPLVLAAYAQGGTFVRAAIKRERTRDAWELIRRGALGPYAARVMAAALLIRDQPLGVL